MPAVLLAVSLLAISPAHGDDAKLWRMLGKGEVFAMMRHAIAPGNGDPIGFKLGDCSTQRNLSDGGRKQARRAGVLFAQNGVAAAMVVSSQWCRCRETATLLDLGSVSDLEALNSFFGNFERRDPQTRALKDWLANLPAGKPLVLVTHQVNISALLGRGTRSGEIIFARRTEDGGFQIEGSLVP